MLESESRALRGSYPNVIFKKKLAPLPLFTQNRIPASTVESPNKDRSIFGSKTSRPELQASGLISPRQPFLNEFKTVNNYGRLCDQPFLEFSNFHYEQVFGSGTGKKKVVLEPLQKKKDKKQKITKLFTLRDSMLGKSSVIKVQDQAVAAPPQININRPKPKVKDPNKQKDNQSVIKKVYQIGDYEAIVGFHSFEVVLTLAQEEPQTFSVRLGLEKLRKIYKFSHSEIVSNILESLVFKDGKLKIKVTREAKQDRYIGDETYPSKKENIPVKIDGENYKATIHFPYLETSIKVLDYHEKVMLKPLFLANLFEEKFNNLQDYIQKFNLPREVTKTKEEIHHEELRNLPTIIKKVVKTLDFGGLVLFKSLEVHLKNTSEFEPETFMHESSLTPMNQKILRKKKKDVNSVLLRLRLDEVLKLLKSSPEEITELIKDSIVVEEGTGFAVNLDQEKLNNIHQRNKIEAESFPEYGEKFTVRFNRFLYEGFIKFPTLELYIPETNYKDVIQLKPFQLEDLIDGEFKNIEAYLHYFKKPVTEPVHIPEAKQVVKHNEVSEEPEQTEVQQATLAGEETPKEIAESVEIRQDVPVKDEISVVEPVQTTETQEDAPAEEVELAEPEQRPETNEEAQIDEEAPVERLKTTDTQQDVAEDQAQQEFTESVEVKATEEETA